MRPQGQSSKHDTKPTPTPRSKSQSLSWWCFSPLTCDTEPLLHFLLLSQCVRKMNDPSHSKYFATIKHSEPNSVYVISNRPNFKPSTLAHLGHLPSPYITWEWVLKAAHLGRQGMSFISQGSLWCPIISPVFPNSPPLFLCESSCQSVCWWEA